MDRSIHRCALYVKQPIFVRFIRLLMMLLLFSFVCVLLVLQFPAPKGAKRIVGIKALWPLLFVAVDANIWLAHVDYGMLSLFLAPVRSVRLLLSYLSVSHTVTGCR